MTGNVSARQAELPVTFRLPGRPDLTLSFVVDTGFAGSLTLPPDAVSALGLRYLARLPANLADDSSVLVGMYEATIVWDGVERQVQVLAMGRRPLLGTGLLDGYALGVHFTEGGLVAVTRL